MTIILTIVTIITIAALYQGLKVIRQANDFNFDFFDPSTFYPKEIQQELKNPRNIFAEIFVLIMYGLTLSTVNLWQDLFNLMWVPIVAVLLDSISSIVEFYWAYTNRTPLAGIVKGYYGKQFAYWYNIYIYSVFIISYILLIIYK